jgi:hypothetical protein
MKTKKMTINIDKNMKCIQKTKKKYIMHMYAIRKKKPRKMRSEKRNS